MICRLPDNILCRIGDVSKDSSDAFCERWTIEVLFKLVNGLAPAIENYGKAQSEYENYRRKSLGQTKEGIASHGGTFWTLPGKCRYLFEIHGHKADIGA